MTFFFFTVLCSELLFREFTSLLVGQTLKRKFECGKDTKCNFIYHIAAKVFFKFRSEEKVGAEHRKLQEK